MYLKTSQVVLIESESEKSATRQTSSIRFLTIRLDQQNLDDHNYVEN